MIDLKMKSKDISQLPPGTTGYKLITSDDYCSQLVSGGVNLTEGNDFFRGFPMSVDDLLKALEKGLVGFPDHCNPLPFLRVKDQMRKGACAGFGSAQAGEGCQWIKTKGEIVRFSGDAHYWLAQRQGGLLGRDVGSLPSDNAWVAQNIGFVTEESYGPAVETYDQIQPVTDEQIEIAGKYKMRTIVRFRDPKQMIAFVASGQGFATIGSIWPAHFDQNKMQPITSFFGPRRNDQHGGGHMYAIMGFYKHPQYGICALLVNSWNTHWGDEGARLITLRALMEMFGHQFTVALGWSDMDLAERAARKVDFEVGDLL